MLHAFNSKSQLIKLLFTLFSSKCQKGSKFVHSLPKALKPEKFTKVLDKNLTCSQWRQKHVFFQEVAFSTPPPPRCIFHSHPQSFSTPLSLYSHFSLLPVGSSHVLVLKSHSFVLPDNIDKIKYIACDE